MNLLDVSNILMYLQTITDHHGIRTVNLEIVYEQGHGIESGLTAMTLSEKGIDAQAMALESPDGEEFPAIVITGW